jgi:2-methylisocitrate lyase-like PEP mutase family enzyme
MTSRAQYDRAVSFRALHRPGEPVVLINIWDLGSARVVAEAGAAALATSSWSVARARGEDDGEQTRLDDVIALTGDLASATHLPVSVDLESGYGATPEVVGTTVRRAIGAGAVGCNLEDTRPGASELLPSTDQMERLRAARSAADDCGVPAFVNARTDVFLLASRPHDRDAVDDVVRRARVYADAGADGLFAPGLADLELIARLVEGSPLPVNIMTGPGSDLPAIASTGVARISYGASSYVAAVAVLESLTKQALVDTARTANV